MQSDRHHCKSLPNWSVRKFIETMYMVLGVPLDIMKCEMCRKTVRKALRPLVTKDHKWCPSFCFLKYVCVHNGIWLSWWNSWAAQLCLLQCKLIQRQGIMMWAVLILTSLMRPWNSPAKPHQWSVQTELDTSRTCLEPSPSASTPQWAPLLFCCNRSGYTKIILPKEYKYTPDNKATNNNFLC